MSAAPTTALDLSIGGRAYRLAVPQDDAARLIGLAGRVGAVLSDIKQNDPLVDRDRQLVLTCLQLVADLSQTEQQLDEHQGAVTRFHRHLAERLESLLP